MEKKESYKHILPHFQQPGQSYFVTWSLHDAIPPKALARYTSELNTLKSQMKFLEQQKADLSEIEKIKQEYYPVRRQYIKAYDDLLDLDRNPEINLSKPENLDIMLSSLQFWQGKRLQNIAFTIMPNHVHWVVRLFDKDPAENPVYLQDILQSVKRHSSNKINKAENRSGTLWQKESFDTTIRNDKHLYYAVKYTLNNPVKAGLVSDWRDWKGIWVQRFLIADLGCSDF
jgi:REP element-mobilizing transposase RayT